MSIIRLPEWAVKEIEKFAEERSLAFATAVRCIVVEHLKETASTKPTQSEGN